LGKFSSESKKQEYLKLVQDNTERHGFNFSNVRKVRSALAKHAYLWDLSNFSFSYAYSEMMRSSTLIDSYTQLSQRGSVLYAYTSNSNFWEPFGKMNSDSPWLLLVKDMNINLKASLIHILGDVIQNIGVIFAALIIFFFPDLTIFDPLCTYVFSFIVLFTTFRIVKECLLILMEGSPEMNLEELKNDLLKINGVKDVHDLHVWSLSQGKVSFSCHLISDLPQVSLKKAKRNGVK
jgi:cation diffusion facilitator family transporter